MKLKYLGQKCQKSYLKIVYELLVLVVNASTITPIKAKIYHFLRFFFLFHPLHLAVTFLIFCQKMLILINIFRAKSVTSLNFCRFQSICMLCILDKYSTKEAIRRRLLATFYSGVSSLYSFFLAPEERLPPKTFHQQYVKAPQSEWITPTC